MRTTSVIGTTIIGFLAVACGGGGTANPTSAQPSALTGDPSIPVIPNLTQTPTFSDSTVPTKGAGKGDVNPYGVAFVPSGFPDEGLLQPGDVIVANFNDSTNAQGTGTTIVRVNTNAAPSIFFRSKLQGLSTALGVLQSGYVLVGNLPSTGKKSQRGVCTPGPNGEELGVGQGALQIIDLKGKLVTTLTSPEFLDGPWDLTVKDDPVNPLVFVSNALSGTVTRLKLLVTGDGDGHHDDTVTLASATTIASGYLHRCDPAAFVVGPTGVALDETNDILYVASTGDNEIFAIDGASDASDAGPGRVVVNDPAHLHGPLGLALAPNGDLVSAQGDAVNPNPDPNGQSLLLEFTTAGAFVPPQFSVEPTTAGAAFGLAVEPTATGFRFAAVDDAVNTLDLWVFP
jgi:hypothetical protein